MNSHTAGTSSAPTAQASKGGGRERLIELDVLRGLAALVVVLFHYTVRYDELFTYASPPLFRVTQGFYGVEFFFGISGFVIFMTLDRSHKAMDFVVSRFSRLWPAYIAAMILTFALVHLVGLPGREATFGQALVNLSMLQELLGVAHVDGVYWTLQIELFFYAGMLLVFALGLLSRIRLLVVLWLMVPVLYFAARVLLHRELSYLAGELLIVRFSPFFAIGLAAYHLRKSSREPSSSGVYDLLLMVLAVVVAAVCLSPALGVVALCSSGVFYAVARGYLGWLARQPFVFLGTISYTLYLVHQNIGYIVIRELLALGVTTNLAITLAVFASIGLAAGLTYAVERPAMKWIRAWYRSGRDSVPRPSEATIA